MPTKPRRIKIITNKDRGAQIIDTETGQDLSPAVIDVCISINNKTGMRAEAQVTFFDVDVEIDADCEVERTLTWKKLIY